MRLRVLLTVIVMTCLAGAGVASNKGQSYLNTRGLLVRRIPAAAVPVQNNSDAARYIVILRDAPVPLYKGILPGLKSASVQSVGARHPDLLSANALAYAAYLKTRHDQFLQDAAARLGHTLRPHFQYRYALNGMSLSLTPKERVRLDSLPEVKAVEPVRYYRPQAATGIPASAGDTYYSRSWIGAPAVWKDPTNGTDNEGEGIVVADIDTGINAANSSYAATGPKDGYVTVNPLGSGKYLGVCDPNNTTDGTLADLTRHPQTYQPGFPCNDKLIGAYTYTLGSGNDPDSPEDSEGHGSQTAGIMAGNFVDVNLSNLGITQPISGVAPHANIIAYDVCDPTNLCGTDTSVAAINQVIRDLNTLEHAPGTTFKGMVLNYSIGGGENPYSDPVEQALLSAVNAGIYVSASGGNGGPAAAILNDPTQLYPVEHWGPWVASTAASTHDGVFGSNNVSGFTGGDSGTLPSGTYTGVGVTGALAASDIVYAGDGSYDYSPYPGSFSTSATYTLSGEAYFDPSTISAHKAAAECLYPFPAGTFTGEIVVCDRGDIPLVDKADNAYQGGAAGIVIVSQSGNALIAESYEIPGTMIDNADGTALENWLTSATTLADKGTASAAQAQLTGSTMTSDPGQADQVASFSSRGPTNTVYDDLIKPDLTAPGVAVLAAVANPKDVNGGMDQPETYDFYDGTSMASPHDAGAAALVMQLHPDWTPAEIRSALMLTATTSTLTDQCASLDSSNNCVASSAVPSPQVRGAGRIDVDAASRSGLIMDENGADYAAADPATGGDLTSLNLPGLANHSCLTTCSWTRTVSSAFSSATASYTVAVSNQTSGLKVSVSPSSFTLAPGATQTLKITADVSGLSYNQWAFAQLNITSGGNGDDGRPIPAMHLPLAVKPIEPEPDMTLSPSASLSLNVRQGGSTQAILTIGNTGQTMLNWQVNTASNSNLTTPLWYQPDIKSTQGYPSVFFAQDNVGQFSTDRFLLPVKGRITTITMTGFAQTGSSVVSVNTASRFDWYIYPENTKTARPYAYPDGTANGYAWHYSTTPGTPGLSIGATTVTLDLQAAGQPAINLPAGAYWLFGFPTFNQSAQQSNATTWYWLRGKSADGIQHALFIDPQNQFGSGTGWQILYGSLEYTLTGTFDCTGSSVTGMTFSEQNGKIAAGGSHDLTLNYSVPADAGVGDLNEGVCISGNDPAHPVIAEPLIIAVQPLKRPSVGGIGGGGAISLLSLALFGLTGLRRKWT